MERCLMSLRELNSARISVKLIDLPSILNEISYVRREIYPLLFRLRSV